MRIFILILFVVAVLTACDLNGRDKGGGAPVAQAAVAAGSGEQSFTERYRVDLKLPMPEERFLSMVRDLKLTYVPCGGRHSDGSIPEPRHLTTVDLSRAVRCYEIGGDVDGIRHIGKRYRAFVDSSNNVIYVENAFSYTGT